MAQAQQDKLTGIISRVLHRNDTGFIIFRLRAGNKEFVVNGEDQSLFEADVVTCEGAWTIYKGEQQFKAKLILPEIPSTSDAIEAYLASGRIKGISTAFAKRLIDAFGKDVLNVIENEPERLSKVPGFGKKRVRDLVEGLGEQIGYRSILVFLHGFGLNKRHIKAIYERYGLTAVEKLRENPYRLCNDIDGIGFPIADRIGLSCGIALDNPQRLKAGIKHVLDRHVGRTGDTGMRKSDLVSATAALFSSQGEVNESDIADYLSSMTSSPSPVVEKTIEGELVIFPKGLAESEDTIARSIRRLSSVTCKTQPDPNLLDDLIEHLQTTLSTTFHENQRDAIKQGLISPVSIVTGGPGTGKTTILRALLTAFKDVMGMSSQNFALCAPTGKAAKRMAQSTKEDAVTIHRVLALDPIEWEFTYNEERPMPVDVVVVDEFSMADTAIAASLFQAVATGARLVILGDVDQLASVGPGKVLKDLIDSGAIPTTRLTKIYRQSENSHISSNAHLINNGEMPLLTNLGKESDFWYMRADFDEACLSTILGLTDRVAKYYNLDRLEDIQVLSPMRKGLVGVNNLNRELQKALNPNGKGLRVKRDGEDVEFRPGDKVMHIVNNKALGVFNGETGRVVSVNVPKRSMIVNFEGRQVEYAQIDIDELTHSFAMTIHKSQGSEFPCVIIPATRSHFNMLFRNLFYTGVTRAKMIFIFVGSLEAIRLAVSRVSSEMRLTGLKALLQG